MGNNRRPCKLRGVGILINSNKAIELIKKIIIKYKDTQYDDINLVDLFHDIDVIISIIESTDKNEVIKDSTEIIKDLASISTAGLNRDYCWGCKLKIICDLKGSLLCKGYSNILNEIDDIINKYEP